MGMETGHKMKPFSKTQTRWLQDTTSFLHSTLGRPQSLPQSVDSRSDKLPDRNKPQPSDDRIRAVPTCPKSSVIVAGGHWI